MDQTSSQPNTSAAVQTAEARLRTLLPSVYHGRSGEVSPVSMGSAPLTFDMHGKIAWDLMWGSFCDLAMAGGPPHRGKLLGPGTPESILAEPVRYTEVCDEIVRGIGLAARLQASTSLPGWVRVQCSNHTMAEWLLRAITMENVSVRMEEGAILLPAGPAFRMEKEIKNVITVVAKTTHYWSGHLVRLQQFGIANLFSQLDSEAPLFQPAWESGTENANSRKLIERALENATGLRITNHGYADWVGLDCDSIPSAITTMCRLVASNILCRREGTAILLPLNSQVDPHGVRLSRSVAELLA